MNNEKLLPCPLRAETDILEEDSRCKCTNCSCDAMCYDWNTRTSPPANDADVVEVMAEAIYNTNPNTIRESHDKDADYHEESYGELTQSDWQYYQDQAQAALKALADNGYRITKIGE